MNVYLHAPIERAWAFLTDYAGYARIPAIAGARVIKPGDVEPAGVGAVREVTVMGSTFEEEILAFEPPRLERQLIVGGRQRRSAPGDAGQILGQLAKQVQPPARVAGHQRQVGIDGLVEVVVMDAVDDAIGEHRDAERRAAQLADEIVEPAPPVEAIVGGLVRQQPALAADVIWGARALVELEGRFARRLLDAWAQGRSSLLERLVSA